VQLYLADSCKLLLIQASAARAAAKASGVLRLEVDTPSAQRLFRPASTLPGPHSTRLVAPLAARVCTDSTQRTGLYNCSSRSRLRVSRSAGTWALTFCTTGICGACQSIAAIDSAKRSAAGRISSQCDGTLTGTGMAR